MSAITGSGDYEVKEQTASQDYDCDTCDLPIPEETRYMRVAKLSGRKRKNAHGGWRPSAVYGTGIEKHHVECWANEEKS